MTNMPIQPLWLTYFIEILLVLEFQLTKTYFGTFSYKAHFRPQISSNVYQFAYNYFMFRSVLFRSKLFYVISVLFGCKYREGTKTIFPYQCNWSLWDHSLETLEKFISINSFIIINPSILSQISFIASFLSHIANHHW